MAWSRLQSAEGSSSSSTSCAATYGTSLTSGTKLIAEVCAVGATTLSVKDGAGNTLTRIAVVDLDGSSSNGELSLWAMDTPAADAGTKPTLTATLSTGSFNFTQILIQEISGLATAPATAYTLHSQGSYGLGNGGSSSGFTLGTQFSVSQAMNLTGIWWYSGPSAAVLPTACCLWDAGTGTQIPGTLNSSPSWSGAAGSGWVKCSYSGPVLSSGTNYVVSVFYNGGSVNWYYDLAGYWTTGAGSSGLTHGPLSAPNSASAVNGQAVFVASSGSIAFPNTTTGGYDFGVDVEVTGASLSAMIDGTPGTNDGATNGTLASPSYSSSLASEYLVACYGDDGSGGAVTWTKPSGFTADANSVNGGGSFGFDTALAYGNSTGGSEAGGYSVSGGPNNWGQILAAFKLSGGGGSNPSGTVQPRATVPAPRRRRVRALWQRVTGQAFTAVPAPAQQPRPAPRRKLARAVWRTAAGQAFAQVPAPRQQPAPAPRRKLARAVIRFTPVTTTNGAPVIPPSGTVQPRATLTAVRRHPARAVIQFTPVTTVNAPPGTEGGPVYYPYHHRAPARGRGR